MLEIKNICKQYNTGGFVQCALDDVSLNLRDNEFVSILGPSGSGKTTLLNIIGGLDKYDSGDIIINNVSTKNYKDRDWDSYRAHSVGFIFQSYNLIPHQTILRNVEIALRISNVPSKERKQRAKEALEKVGLGKHINKKPNQLSGGQMQRVAIARALVNNPKIILADEPTGALDTKTSVQVMELLKEVAKDRLVVMVTHNPELAYEYSTRIVELRDGVLQSDSNPYVVEKDANVKVSTRNFGKVGMSLPTSMRLSCSNLWSKIKRTTLVAVAGSIGIIGISLIMSISNGANDYIQSMEEQTLSEYPLTIQKATMDMSSMAGLAGSIAGGENDDKIHEQQVISSLFGTRAENNLSAFKAHLDSGKTSINDYVNAIEYGYGLVPYIYYVENDKARQVSPDNIIDSAGLTTLASLFAGQTTTFNSLPADDSLYKTKYDVVEGRWPESPNELVVILGPGNTISDLALYNMGLKDYNKLDAMIESFNQNTTENQLEIGNPEAFPFKDVIGKEFNLVNAYKMYNYDEQLGCWVKISAEAEVQAMAKQGSKLTIVGVARPNAENDSPTITPAIYYTSDLVVELIEDAQGSQIVKEQLNDMEINIFTGKRFDDKDTEFDMSKLFNFDETAFDEVFAVDPESIEMDMSGFNSINIGNFNIGNYINKDIIKDLVGTITEDTIRDLFENVTVDITQEKLNALFTDLYKDFLDSTNNAHNMNVDNMGPAISRYLRTDRAKEIIKNVILGSMENAEESILSSSEFTSQAAKFVVAYLNYTAANGLDPSDQANVQAFAQTGEAQAIISAMSNAAADAITEMLASSEVAEKMITGLAEDYDLWAAENNEPVAKEIAEKFLEYLGTERAMEIIMEHAELMIDMEQLRENLDQVATDVGKEVSSIINSTLSSAVKHLGSQLGYQIENAIVTAMTSYMENLKNSFDFSTESLMDVVDANMSAESIQEMLSNVFAGASQTAKSNLKTLGYADLNDPETITFYPKDFEAKEGVIQILNDYNEMMKEEDEEKVVKYTDMVGSLMTSVTDIIDIIGYVLIAFVSVSLIVSSIMIGVITYISVLERKKEIGILRAMGASKRNITQVFNCETIITGFLAGLIGVVMTWLILIPANAILQYVTGAPNLHGFLPVDTAVLLVLLSMTLTTIGGLLPSKSAAKQDPVIALRAE